MYRKQLLDEAQLRELWFRHQADEEWFLEGNDRSAERIRALFGPPPYEFLRLGDPVPLTMPGSRKRLVQATDARGGAIRNDRARALGQRAYSGLPKQPEYIDQHERQYWIKEQLPGGVIVLRYRMPIRVKRLGAEQPRPGDRLQLYGERPLECTVERTNIKPGSATGEVEISSRDGPS